MVLSVIKNVASYVIVPLWRAFSKKCVAISPEDISCPASQSAATHLKASDSESISAQVVCSSRVWSLRIRLLKPGICFAQPIVATSSRSMRSLSMQIVLYWDDETGARARELLLVAIGALTASSGSGSQFSKAATILFSAPRDKANYIIHVIKNT